MHDGVRDVTEDFTPSLRIARWRTWRLGFWVTEHSVNVSISFRSFVLFFLPKLIPPLIFRLKLSVLVVLFSSNETKDMFPTIRSPLSPTRRNHNITTTL